MFFNTFVGVKFGSRGQLYNDETSGNQPGIGLGNGVTVAKSCGALLKLNCALILVPVLRNVLGWVRNLPISVYLPLDKNLVFHKKIAIVIAVVATVHTVAHCFNVMRMAAQQGASADARVRSLRTYSRFVTVQINNDYINPYWWAFASLPGWTGFALLVVMMLLYSGAWKKLRNSNFENFWYSHHMFIAFYVLLFPHGMMNYFGVTEMWMYGSGPVLLYGLERLIRYRRGVRSTILHQVRKHPSGVIEVQVKVRGMRYKAGQYVFLNVPMLSNWEWHPFTISSAPEEAYLSCHIKQVGDWTKSLARLFNPRDLDAVVIDREVNDDGVRLIRVDGPFGAPSEDFNKFGAVMLVGAGIGVTPFASILKSVGYNIQRPPGESKLKSIMFFWVMREHAGFEWFADVLAELEAVNQYGVLQINNYMTGQLKPDEIRSIMYSENVRDPLTGLRAPTHYGRPAWGTIFKEVVEKHRGQHIGVFFCGPRILSKELYAQTKTHQDPVTNTRITYHKENF